MEAVLVSLQDQVSCSLCLEVFHDPRELSCRHTLCFKCCKSLYEVKSTILCPLCRIETVSQPEVLPLDFKVAKCLETYNSVKLQVERSTGDGASADTTSNTSKSVSVTGKCRFPGCTEDATGSGPSSRLALCSQHLSTDIKKMKKTVEELQNRVSKFIGSTEKTDKKDDIEKLEKCLEFVSASLREMQKSIDLKRSELEGDLMALIGKMKHSEKEAFESRNDLELKRDKLDKSMQSEDFMSAGKIVIEIETLLDHISYAKCWMPRKIDTYKLEDLMWSTKSKCDEFVQSCGIQIVAPTMPDNAQPHQELSANVRKDEDTRDDLVDLTFQERVKFDYTVSCITILCYTGMTQLYYYRYSSQSLSTQKVDRDWEELPRHSPLLLVKLTHTKVEPFNSIKVYSLQNLKITELCRVHIDITRIPDYDVFVFGPFCSDNSQRNKQNSLFIENGDNRLFSMSIDGKEVEEIKGFDKYIIGLEVVVNPEDVTSARLFVFSNEYRGHKLLDTSNYEDELGKSSVTVYSLQEGEITMLKKIKNIDAVDASATYEKIFTISSYQKTLCVYSVESGETLMKTFLTLDSVVEICAIGISGFLFIKDDKARLYCYTNNTLRFVKNMCSELVGTTGFRRSPRLFTRICAVTWKYRACVVTGDITGKELLLLKR